MIKKLFTLGLALAAFAGNAQQAKKQAVLKKNAITSSLKVNHNNSLDATPVCDTITTITSNDTLTLYTTGTGTAAGYVSGNNYYGDKAKANFFPAAYVPATGQITGVIAVFFQESATSGTHGTGNISIDILNGDTTTGPTGSPLATATASLGTIAAIPAANESISYLFNFATPVAAPAAGFFASLNLPTVTGDTAVLLMTKDASDAHNFAWDKNGTSWLAFSNTNDWSLESSLTLYPIVCVTSAGIKANVLQTNIAYFPNPTNGQFNFAVALPEATNLNISVVNQLGQVVFNKTENGISNSVLSYDLTSIGKGMYFVNITDSKNNKVTKKVIVE